MTTDTDTAPQTALLSKLMLLMLAVGVVTFILWQFHPPQDMSIGVPQNATGSPSIVALVWLVVMFGFYFLPTVFAIDRKHPQRTAIIVLNVVAGWSLVGWIIALVWAFTKPRQA